MSWKEQLGLGRVRWPSGRDVVEYLRGLVFDDLPFKLLAIIAAFGVWFFVNASARDTELALAIPLELRNRPKDLIDVSPRVEFADLRVSGPRTLLSRIDRDNLAVVLDLAGVRPGPAVFRLQTESLNLPRGVKVVRLTPSEVTLDFARILQKSIPVRIAVAGKPPGGLRVVNSKATPDTVKVIGPEDDVSRLKLVETTAVDLGESQPGLIERDVNLESPREYVAYSTSLVHVQIELAEPEETKVFKAMPIVVRNGVRSVTVAPGFVDVTVRGARSAVQSLELAHGAVYIQASDKEPGDYRVEPSVDLPPDVELVSQEPTSVRLRVAREKKRGER